MNTEKKNQREEREANGKLFMDLAIINLGSSID